MTDMIQAGVRQPVRLGPLRRVAIVVSLLLIVVAASASLFLVRTVDSQLDDIAGAYEVRRQARDLLLAVVDAETGQRGYLLTRDARYLDPYNRAIATMDDTYRRLLELVDGTAARRDRIAVIADDLERKRDELTRTIDLASGGNPEAALAVVRSNAGAELMARLRQVVNSFIADEDAALVDRNRQMEANRQWLVAAIVAALGAAAALAYALFARTQRQVTALAQSHSALRSANEDLEARVLARTAEAEESRARAERERERLETLLQDTNHRIGNSLATVSSLLGLQLGRSQSAEVREALEAAQARVHAVASSHRRLRLGADLETTDAADLLQAVVADIEESIPEDRNVEVHCALQPMVISARDATTLGIVLAELVTNALKHAFGEGAGGSIWVRLDRAAAGTARFVVEDNGRGLTRVAHPDSEPGLGAVIVSQLARQFGGAVEYAERDGGGTVVMVLLPGLEIVSG
ncbi:MAG: CHASE3 domain-containing protein [Devosia sp.]|nr:CHASE3 domain-containing protein [Devosia sp.]